MSLFTFLSIFAIFIMAVTIVFKDEIKSTQDKDPAAKSFLEIVILYSGLHAIILYRIANFLFKCKIPIVPRLISQISRFFTGVEIHPGATISHGLFIDHGMGVVIGETTIIDEHVTLFQGVTLGGTGKETGKRHPTIGKNVVIGAGAKVLGDITVGDNCYVGANAVILKDVPANSTVVGVPGHITKQEGKKIDLSMDHVRASDPIMTRMKEIVERIEKIESKNKNSAQ